MTQLLRPSACAAPVLAGALGGALAAGLALAVAGFLATLAGHAPVAAPNAVGAWLVRWLQVAAPQALDNFYPDASLGGAALTLAAGALLGAVAGGLWARGADAPWWAWALGAAILVWAALHWLLIPALDPLLGRVLGPSRLALVCLVFWLPLGWWLGSLRARTAAAP